MSKKKQSEAEMGSRESGRFSVKRGALRPSGFRPLAVAVSALAVAASGLVIGVAAPAVAAPATQWTNADAFSPELSTAPSDYTQDVRLVDLGQGVAMSLFRLQEFDGSNYWTSLKYSLRDVSGAWTTPAYVGASDGTSWSTTRSVNASPGFDATSLSDGSVLVAYHNGSSGQVEWMQFTNGSWTTPAPVASGTWGSDCEGQCLIALPSGKALLAWSDSNNAMTYTVFDVASGWGSRTTSVRLLEILGENFNSLALAADGSVFIAFVRRTGSFSTPGVASVSRVDPTTLVDDTPVNVSTANASSDKEPPSLVVPAGTSNALVGWRESSQVYLSQFDSTQSFTTGWSTKAALPSGSGSIGEFPTLAALSDGRVAVAVNRGASVQAMISVGTPTGGGTWPSSWTTIGDVSSVGQLASVADRISMVPDGDDLVGIVAADSGGNSPSGVLAFGLNGETSQWSPLSTASLALPPSQQQPDGQYFGSSFQDINGLALASHNGVPITAWDSTFINGNPTTYGLVSTTNVVPATPSCVGFDSRQQTQTTGVMVCEVPAGVTSLNVEITGAGGGGAGGTATSRGGHGAVAQGLVDVTPGTLLTVEVGTGGGGAPGGAGGGGGWTAIRSGGNLLIVAGGGGGAGSQNIDGQGSNLPAGSSLAGGDAASIESDGLPQPRTTGLGEDFEGGLGAMGSGAGTGGYGFASSGSNGMSGRGGNGGIPCDTAAQGGHEWRGGTQAVSGSQCPSAEGGGSGYFGGGGGGAGYGFTNAGGGGGAGSSFGPMGAVFTVAGNGGLAGTSGGNGIAIINAGPVPPPPIPPVAPSVPTSVTAIGGDRSAVVSWSPPSSTGSFPVSTYRAESTSGGQTCLVSAPNLTCTVAGLTNGTSYTFTVEALNGAGWSPKSAPSNAVVPGGVTPAPAPQPLPENLAPGESLLLVNGAVDTNVEVDPNAQSNGLLVTGDNWSMDLDGLGPDGKPLNLGPNGALRLQNERDVATQGTEFLANSEVDLYIDPPVNVTGQVSAAATEAIYVGTVRTDAEGSFAGVATLPVDITAGEHILQAVGYSPTAQTRAMSLGVIVEPWITLDKGTRTPDGRHDRIRTTGMTGGIDAGTKLTPWIRYGGQSEFIPGKATITVQTDGSFRWSRQIRKEKTWTAYVSYLDTESNRIRWLKVRGS